LGAQSAAGLILLIVLAARKQFTLEGITGFVVIEYRHLFKAGGLFFLLQIGTMVGWGADSLIIASTLGVAQVAMFSVVQRLFQFATQPLGVINAPLWGAYADAHARKDKSFIRTTLKRSMQVTFFGAVFGVVVLLLFHTWLIDKWTDGSIVAPILFVALYAVWIIFEACGNAFSMFLNGAGIIGVQVKAVAIFIMLGLPLKIILTMKFGVIGVPIATLVSYSTAVFGIYGFLYRKEIIKQFQ
jgi:O-antigen/teichoic acid export membrane protein